jgi:hypothetical protein
MAFVAYKPVAAPRGAPAGRWYFAFKKFLGPVEAPGVATVVGTFTLPGPDVAAAATRAGPPPGLTEGEWAGFLRAVTSGRWDRF